MNDSRWNHDYVAGMNFNYLVVDMEIPASFANVKRLPVFVGMQSDGAIGMKALS
jgi:hypothetical protein